MPDFQNLPRSLTLMGFRSSFVVNFWAARITLPVEYASVLRQAITAVARRFPQFRVSGYFFDDSANHVIYQINRVPGPLQETLTDEVLGLQFVTLLEYLEREGVPYETQRFSNPPQDEQTCLLFGLGKGFSEARFSGEQVWEVLQRQRERPGVYQQVQIYAVGGGEAVYEEPALLIPCQDEADLHWLCMALLVFWQEWAVVYDRQRSIAYRFLTSLGEVREALYPDE